MADKVAFNCNPEFPSCRLCNSLWILHSDHEVNMIKGSFFSIALADKILSHRIQIIVIRYCHSSHEDIHAILKFAAGNGF